MTEHYLNRDLETQEKKSSLLAALAKVGIDLPLVPQTVDGLFPPREWLIRGETGKKRLLRASPFTPQTGQMGSRGIFLGDCASCLPYSNLELYYVFQTSRLGKKWLVDSSPDYSKQIERIATEKNLDLSKISDGVEADSVLFSRFAVYQLKSGICTLPENLPITEAEYILIHSEVLTDEEKLSLSPDLQNKLVIMK